MHSNNKQFTEGVVEEGERWRGGGVWTADIGMNIFLARVARLSIQYMYPNIGGLYIPRCGAEVSHSGMSSPPIMSTYQSPPLLVGHSG